MPGNELAGSSGHNADVTVERFAIDWQPVHLPSDTACSRKHQAFFRKHTSLLVGPWRFFAFGTVARLRPHVPAFPGNTGRRWSRSERAARLAAVDCLQTLGTVVLNRAVQTHATGHDVKPGKAGDVSELVVHDLERHSLCSWLQERQAGFPIEAEFFIVVGTYLSCTDQCPAVRICRVGTGRMD